MRYVINELPPMKGANTPTRVFSIRANTDPEYKAHHVWYADGRAYCCICQTPLCGMSASCAHAQAVKRFVEGRKPKKEKEPVEIRAPQISRVKLLRERHDVYRDTLQKIIRLAGGSAPFVVNLTTVTELVKAMPQQAREELEKLS